jgi:hypothetical protein
MSASRTGRPYPPRKYSWYSFLLESESNPELQCGRKDYSNDTIGNRTRNLGLVARCLNQPRHRTPAVSSNTPQTARSGTFFCEVGTRISNAIWINFCLQSVDDQNWNQTWPWWCSSVFHTVAASRVFIQIG